MFCLSSKRGELPRKFSSRLLSRLRLGKFIFFCVIFRRLVVKTGLNLSYCCQTTQMISMFCFFSGSKHSVLKVGLWCEKLQGIKPFVQPITPRPTCITFSGKFFNNVESTLPWRRSLALRSSPSLSWRCGSDPHGH